MKEIIIGISAYYHDSAAALIINNEIIAAAQEERFSRIKNDSNFPVSAVLSLLNIGKINPGDVTLVAFYEKNYIKFERLLETYHSFAPKGLKSYLKAMPLWMKEKLFLKKTILDELVKIGFRRDIKIVFPEHHLSHSASAFFPSPFDKAAIMTLDGVGEWDTATIGFGNKSKITILRSLEFPHSIGLLYSAFTYYCGFKVNEGEYKLMGLAPYGNPNSNQTEIFIEKIKSEIVDIKNDGSIVLNLDYFNYPVGLTMTNDSKWKALFGIDRRQPESPLNQDYCDLAYSIQKVTEEIIFKIALTTKELTNCNNLVLAGGVALNSVANGLLLKSGIFEKLWIQPAAGDAGGALGAALAANYIYNENERISDNISDKMKCSLLGPEFKNDEIESVLVKNGIKNYDFIANNQELFDLTAQYINDGKVVGWYRGRMEYGPRALGSRSFLADARNEEMQQKLNLKIKFREGFRPFAPVVMEEFANDWFDIDVPSPYMLNVIPVREIHRISLPENYYEMEMMERLRVKRSSIPAVTHLDYSARIQTVNKELHPDFYGVIESFYKLTGCPIIINTSFNVRDEPIVCTPGDALKCFLRTETDILMLGNYVILKEKIGIIDDVSFVGLVK